MRIIRGFGARRRGTCSDGVSSSATPAAPMHPFLTAAAASAWLVARRRGPAAKRLQGVEAPAMCVSLRWRLGLQHRDVETALINVSTITHENDLFDYDPPLVIQPLRLLIWSVY